MEGWTDQGTGGQNISGVRPSLHGGDIILVHWPLCVNVLIDYKINRLFTSSIYHTSYIAYDTMDYLEKFEAFPLKSLVLKMLFIALKPDRRLLGSYITSKIRNFVCKVSGA